MEYKRNFAFSSEVPSIIVDIAREAEQMEYIVKAEQVQGSHITLQHEKKCGGVVVNIYWKKDPELFTFSSALEHPKKGKTQLFRKNIKKDLVLKLLQNPRKHTNKGYRKT